METPLEIQTAVRKLSPKEQEDLREWIENLLEDRLKMTDDFKAEIEAGAAEFGRSGKK